MNLSCESHIDDAIRALEMMRLISRGKLRLSPNKMKPYYDALIESVLAIQDTLVEDKDYTQAIEFGIEEMSKTRGYSFNVTENNDGDQFYSIEAVLPLKAMKRSVALTGKRHDTVTVSEAQPSRSGAAR
jgi:hypothetical protein